MISRSLGSDTPTFTFECSVHLLSTVSIPTSEFPSISSLFPLETKLNISRLTSQTDDPQLIQKRSDIVHTAAVLLEKSGLIRYDRRSGVFQTNELGRIASGFYVSHTSMGTYNQQLKSATGYIELFRIFSLSEEFKNVPVRAEEK